MDVKSYTLEELESHLLPIYSNPEGAVPLSPLRLRSYLTNPRANSPHKVLFEIHHEGEMVAYRTLLPDCFFDCEGQPNEFAWLSGTWVHPRWRRQGISTNLLEAVDQEWKGRLMYTNYAPASKAVYDHSGRFTVVARREGKRYYLRAASEELVGKRPGGLRLLRWTDLMVNQLRKTKLAGFANLEQSCCRLELVNGFDEELKKVVNPVQRGSLFRRDTGLLTWVLEHPWVTHQEVPPLEYHFSYRARRFENILYKYTHPETDSLGVLWLIIHNNVLSVPYLFAESEAIHPCMAKTILQTMVRSGCTHATIRHPEITTELKSFRSVFLHVRQMPQLILAHRNLAHLIPERSKIHDGDGDVVFTG